MLIYVKIKKNKKCFSSDRRTDGRSTQNYSSEPHKIEIKINGIQIYTVNFK